MNSCLKIALLIILGFIILFIILIATMAIIERPSPEEKQTIEILRKKYGNNYSFNYTLGDSQYLDISRIDATTIEKSEGCKIFKEYLNTLESLSKGPYDGLNRIVNFYEDGQFLFQIVRLKENSMDCDIGIAGKGAAERY